METDWVKLRILQEENCLNMGHPSAWKESEDALMANFSLKTPMETCCLLAYLDDTIGNAVKPLSCLDVPLPV